MINPCTVYDIENAHWIIDEHKQSAMNNYDVDIQWPSYYQMEEMGVMDCIGVYISERLIGYAIMINQVSLHYGKQTTIVESLYVMEEYRATGAGHKLLEAIKEYASKKGSWGLILTAPCDKELETILPAYGFNNTHKVFFKRLD